MIRHNLLPADPSKASRSTSIFVQGIPGRKTWLVAVLHMAATEAEAVVGACAAGVEAGPASGVAAQSLLGMPSSRLEGRYSCTQHHPKHRP